MKFTVHSDALVSALGWVAKSLPNRPSVPVLAGLKMVVANDTLTLSAFDYEQSAVATVEVASSEDGVALVSGRLLADIARALPKSEVTVTCEDTKLLVQARSSKFSLQIMPVSDYPTLPENPPTLGSIDAAEFADAVRSVVPAAGRDDMLPVLTAVSMTVDPETGTITLAATDRYRLAVRTVTFTGEPGAPATTVLIPARTLDQWAKSLPTQPGATFTLGAGDGDTQIFSISTENRSATVRLLDGQFPKYRALLPDTFNSEATLEVADLVAAAKRVSLVAAPGTPIRLAFDADGLTVSAAADDEATEDVVIDHRGESITIGFNIAYLLDGLGALGQQQATVRLVAGTKPAIIRPADESVDYIYLLMPMRGGVN